MLIIFLQNGVLLKNSRDAVWHIYCTTDYHMAVFVLYFLLSKKKRHF